MSTTYKGHVRHMLRQLHQLTLLLAGCAERLIKLLASSERPAAQSTASHLLSAGVLDGLSVMADQLASLVAALDTLYGPLEDAGTLDPISDPSPAAHTAPAPDAGAAGASLGAAAVLAPLLAANGAQSDEASAAEIAAPAAVPAAGEDRPLDLEPSLGLGMGNAGSDEEEGEEEHGGVLSTRVAGEGSSDGRSDEEAGGVEGAACRPEAELEPGPVSAADTAESRGRGSGNVLRAQDGVAAPGPGLVRGEEDAPGDEPPEEVPGEVPAAVPDSVEEAPTGADTMAEVPLEGQDELTELVPTDTAAVGPLEDERQEQQHQPQPCQEREPQEQEASEQQPLEQEAQQQELVAQAEPGQEEQQGSGHEASDTLITPTQHTAAPPETPATAAAIISSTGQAAAAAVSVPHSLSDREGVLRAVFGQLDVDGSGAIDKGELLAALGAMVCGVNCCAAPLALQ